MSNNPYAHHVEGLDPMSSLGEMPRRIEALVAGWPRELFERSYAPGKWTARQLLVHLAHTELAFGERVRFALTKKDYTVLPFEQDDWIALEASTDAAAALAAYLGMRRMNLALFRSLTTQQRAHAFDHPERGRISVDWIITALAGHERHHFTQLQSIAAAAV